MDKEQKSVKEEVKDFKEASKKEDSKNKEKDNDVLEFFLGIIMLGAGLFMLSQRVIVHSGWYGWRIGNFNVSSGLVTVPLIIGIIWLFYNRKSVIPKIIIALGAVIIVAAIIMSIRITFVTTTMFEYIIMIGLAAAGSGLLLKTLLKKRD